MTCSHACPVECVKLMSKPGLERLQGEEKGVCRLTKAPGMSPETGDQSRHLGSQMKSTHLLFEEMKFSYYDAFTNVSGASSEHTNRLQTPSFTSYYLCYILFTVRSNNALQTAHQAFLLLLFQEPVCAES